jgi:hypothetical protein
MPSRRTFLSTLVASAAAVRFPKLATSSQSNASALIDRQSLVRRHDPVNTRIDPLSPLSLGNGHFAFTADVTGLQTLPQVYEKEMPLCTMSEWGWHTTPKPSGLAGATLRLTAYDTYGREVGYQTSSEGQTELFNWLRENPHRLHLGQIGFCRIGPSKSEISSSDVNRIDQRLDLWSGRLSSNFQLDGETCTVTSTVHPDLDLLAVIIESKLLGSGRVGVRFAFPYGSPAMQAADWSSSDKHTTKIGLRGKNWIEFHRALDNDAYAVRVNWQASGELIADGPHAFILKSSRGTNRLAFTAHFSRNARVEPSPQAKDAFKASADHWREFWGTGGCIELAGSSDKRAEELERRIVLSQYLTAIQCSGRLPPQETGLTVNSWYGKFHLEMHWWHAAHFALWDRLFLLERSLPWYQKVLPHAKELARSQGYSGARWPKMVGPEGRDSPSPIGPLLIWQQPHPIFYAELCFQAQPGGRSLERYREIVFESAEFMSSYAHYDEKTERYVLGPPLIPAQENHPPRETWNPTFELAYWVFGLRIAQLWRERHGWKRNHQWDHVIDKLSNLPSRDGVYLAHENCPQTYTERNRDHPSMLGALGVLPGEGVDRETMRRTLHKTMKEWRWADTWGWDYPMTALTAARLGEGKIAIDALLMATEKNRYLPNGHNWQRANLPCYLPGNGGVLYATAMMAAGWKDAPQTHAPGFPDDGSWKVRWEGINLNVTRRF